MHEPLPSGGGLLPLKMTPKTIEYVTSVAISRTNDHARPSHVPLKRARRSRRAKFRIKARYCQNPPDRQHVVPVRVLDTVSALSGHGPRAGMGVRSGAAGRPTQSLRPVRSLTERSAPEQGILVRWASIDRVHANRMVPGR